VLDGLNYIKDQLDGTLSYRWSCRMGICGSCGMTINGEPQLSCATFLTDYAPGPVRVEPLQNFPVIRDLVVEIDDFMRKLTKVKPWLIREEDEPLEDGEYLQTPSEMDDYRKYSMCINCMLCYSACPVYALDPEFIGPAALAKAYRFVGDPRDAEQYERLKDLAEDPAGIYDCTHCFKCIEACPKGVAPMNQIMRLRRIATADEHIVDQNNGERHEAAFTRCLRCSRLSLMSLRRRMPRTVGMRPTAV